MLSIMLVCPRINPQQFCTTFFYEDKDKAMRDYIYLQDCIYQKTPIKMRDEYEHMVSLAGGEAIAVNFVDFDNEKRFAKAMEDMQNEGKNKAQVITHKGFVVD